MKIDLKAMMEYVLWLSGFFLAFFFFPSDNMIQTGAAISCMIGLAGWIVYRKSVSLPKSGLTVLLTALWGWVLVSALASEVKFISLMYVFFFGAFPLSFLISSSLDKGWQILRLARFLILGIGVNSLYQFYYEPDALKFGGTHWPFADNNSLGAMLAAGSLLFFGESLRGGKYIWANLVGALVLAAGVITTEGRAIMLAFGAMSFILVGLELSGQKLAIIWKQVLGFAVGVFLLLGGMSQSDVAIANWFSENGAGKTVESFVTASVDEPNRLSGSRFMMWKSAGQMFAERPFLGSGIGTYYLYYPEHRNPADDSLGLMAHNDLVQFATELGFMGPLLALAIIGFVVVQTGRLYVGTRNDHQARLDVLIPACIFLMLCGHSLVNFNFYVLPTLMLNGLLLGILNRRFADGRELVFGQDSRKRQAAAVIISILMMHTILSLTWSEHFATRARDALAAEDVAGFAKYLDYSETLGMGLNGRVYYQAARFASATNDTQRALILLDKTERVNPRIASIYHERSHLLEKTDPEKSLQQAIKSLTIDAASIPARMHLANLYEARGDRQQAYITLKAGLIGQMRSSEPLPFYERVEKMAEEYNDTETLEKVRKEISRRNRK